MFELLLLSSLVLLLFSLKGVSWSVLDSKVLSELCFITLFTMLKDEDEEEYLTLFEMISLKLLLLLVLLLLDMVIVGLLLVLRIREVGREQVEEEVDRI